ncbi:hypothetical protein V1478_004581 [Vespula squamosa]|uniref:Uncharacterized protein n=1 Tax=Vespula squamosa TaxID=30214 RepID=A0ABD2BGL0_VESSQ
MEMEMEMERRRETEGESFYIFQVYTFDSPQRNTRRSSFRLTDISRKRSGRYPTLKRSLHAEFPWRLEGRGTGTKLHIER